MFFYEGQFCPVCGKPFNESDDVVACPQCGCPHHRACWMQEGHCHFETDHGTPNQWAQGKNNAPKPQSPTRTCPHCGGANPEFAEFCAHCGKEFAAEEPTIPPAPQYTPPVGNYTPPTGNYTPPFSAQPFEDIPQGQTIDGVPLEDVMALVDTNTKYYAKRFVKMNNEGTKISWNWAAFLFSYNWLLYRKNLLWGILLFVFNLALNVINDFAWTPIDQLFSADTTPEMAAQMLEQLIQDSRFHLLALIVVTVGIISIIVSILCGLFGNYLYMKNIVKKARRLRENNTLQYGYGFRKVGGTSFLLAITPNLLVAFVTYVYTFMTMM